MKDKMVFLFIGLFIGWITVPLLQADNMDNTYKGLIHQLIAIVSRIEISSAQTATNTQKLCDKLGAK
jgi:hypothetical protein